jgi:hypothetical protein
MNKGRLKSFRRPHLHALQANHDDFPHSIESSLELKENERRISL